MTLLGVLNVSNLKLSQCVLCHADPAIDLHAEQADEYDRQNADGEPLQMARHFALCQIDLAGLWMQINM